MPFYFRKSVSAGPFRFNFSKGGVGMSVGVKGLRVGAGPRGHYVNVGAKGIYYRASLGRAGQKPSQQHRPIQEPPLLHPDRDSGAADVEMVEIDSGDVLGMRDENFTDLLDEINQKQAQFSMATKLAIAATVVALIAWWAIGSNAWIAIVLVVPAYIVGKWLDSYRRSAVLFYDLDEYAQTAFESVVQSFDNMMKCEKKWHIRAGGDIRDLTTWKRNAGASKLVDKKPTILEYELPKVIRSNLTPPAIHVGKQIVYLFPDLALVEDGGRFGAVGYPNLRVQWEDSPFIEDGSVPRDAEVMGHTWLHPNKSGGPDRRYRDNRQIPICLYETMLLHSNSGVNEALQFSRTGVTQPLSQSLKGLPKQPIAISSKAK